MEKYSVLMSLYVNEKPEYVPLAIDSMINQTIKPDEIIIVEDGPLNERLYSIVNDYCKRFPDLFTIVINERNIGLGLALNEGIKVARNELIARMDTDDISRPERCEKQLAVFEKNPQLSIVGAWVDEFYCSPEEKISTRVVPETNAEIYKFSRRRSAFNHPVVMYRKSSVLKKGGYADLRRNQDVDLFGRMLFGGMEAYNIQESLLWFRSNKDLAKRRKSWENTKSYISTIRKFWKMGFSTWWDYIVIASAQMVMFIMPVKVQEWIYKTFLRK